jgi:hypothetical protein
MESSSARNRERAPPAFWFGRLAQTRFFIRCSVKRARTFFGEPPKNAREPRALLVKKRSTPISESFSWKMQAR